MVNALRFEAESTATECRRLRRARIRLVLNYLLRLLQVASARTSRRYLSFIQHNATAQDCKCGAAALQRGMAARRGHCSLARRPWLLAVPA
jgi:hypothetical protein